MDRSLEEFPEGLRGVLLLSEIEARRQQHSYIGTEHLLLALLRTEGSLACRVLGRLGLSLGKIRGPVLFIIGSPNKRWVSPETDLFLTSRSEEVILLAEKEADLSGEEVGQEHLLLGLLLEGQGIAASVLDSLGVTYESVCAELVRIRSN